MSFFQARIFNNTFAFTSIAKVNDFSGMFYDCPSTTAYNAVNSAAKNAIGTSTWVNVKNPVG